MAWSPVLLEEFIGQADFVRQVQIEIAAARKQKRAPHHMILHGPHGLGKTTLARLIGFKIGWHGPMVGGVPAKTEAPVELNGSDLTIPILGRHLVEMEGPGYDAKGYIVDPEQLIWHTVVIDECQSVSRELLNWAHQFLTPQPDGRIIVDIVLNTGKTRRVWIQHFTLILLTNYLGALTAVSAPSVSRFPLCYQFQYYTHDELTQMVLLHAREQQINITEGAARIIAEMSHGTARLAVDTYLGQAANYRDVVFGADTIDPKVVHAMLKGMGIDHHGLDQPMRDYLRAVAEVPQGLGLNALQATLGIDTSTIENCIEPILLRKRFINRESRRKITPAGLDALGGNSYGQYSNRVV